MAAEKLLGQLELDKLDEIELRYPVARRDLADQALSGTKWVDSLFADAQADTVARLKTTARIVIKPSTS